MYTDGTDVTNNFVLKYNSAYHNNMKKIFLKWFKWVSVASQRYCIFTLLSFGLAFFIPFVGWNPILLLWTVNAYLSYREEPYSKIRFVYIAVIFLFSIVMILNLSMGVFALMQCFGYFV